MSTTGPDRATSVAGASRRPPALAVTAGGAYWLSADGEIERLSHDAAAARLALERPLVCHAPDAGARLRLAEVDATDVLELFAFVRPARFCLPTIRGLAAALDLATPATPEDDVVALPLIAETLLDELADARHREPPATAELARRMAAGGWPWGAAVCAALGVAVGDRPRGFTGLDTWKHLPAWEDDPPATPPRSLPVEPHEARARLADLVHAGAGATEVRPTQSDYASAVSLAFLPRERENEPRVVLAEAGTGTGKTLGYVAPASLWAERNGAPVWIATFTRNLQRQIDGELDRLHPDDAAKRARVVVRKGRENYLCLLNYEEAVQRTRGTPQNAVGLGLLARWTMATRDGDMVGGDLPAWLGDLIGRARLSRLADRRGECVYAGCDHYRRCFVERTIRRARHADIVIANHALVMMQAATGGLDDNTRPTRYVFDEGHHLFDAADSAFAAHLTGVEGSDLRRWLLGAEGRGGRARGLQRRVNELAESDPATSHALRALLDAAQALPSAGWQTRLADGTTQGDIEDFLALVRQQVLARAPKDDNPYRIECDVRPVATDLVAAARACGEAIEAMLKPALALIAALARQLDEGAETLDTSQRNRIEGITRSLRNRCQYVLAAWIGMLKSVESEPQEAFVDWFAIERIEGREYDVGMYRHYVDPTQPFAEAVVKPAHGVVITSATLRDWTGANDPPPTPTIASGALEAADWDAAEARTGARHLAAPAIRAAVASPFDYAANTRVLIVRDVARDSVEQVAAAYRALFLAADGGGLGLFTAIGRLRAVHRQIAAPLEEAGIPLYAQHVGGMDAATLVDIFRAEERSCLLGTDAVRDGVDVPGRSLRLIVFDRVPWPRPDILHRARKDAHRAAGHGANAYDDMLTRFRLKQAFGRLVRRADDRGVFVMLDNRLASRLLAAFPAGVSISRVGLADAIKETRDFLKMSP
ncbi:MAG: ATP-dependent DNA helicase [Alphaproteobacteria bacterium]|nr:ATP-dependent DNA helicase [Alphaproteobacteria bacterium]